MERFPVADDILWINLMFAHHSLRIAGHRIPQTAHEILSVSLSSFSHDDSWFGLQPFYVAIPTSFLA
jgi:hypothetical protein